MYCTVLHCTELYWYVLYYTLLQHTTLLHCVDLTALTWLQRSDQPITSLQPNFGAWCNWVKVHQITLSGTKWERMKWCVVPRPSPAPGAAPDARPTHDPTSGAARHQTIWCSPQWCTKWCSSVLPQYCLTLLLSAGWDKCDICQLNTCQKRTQCTKCRLDDEIINLGVPLSHCLNPYKLSSLKVST